MFTQFKTALLGEALKGTPPLAIVASSWYLKLNLDDWLKIATIGYVILQAVYLLWRWWQDHKKGRRARK